MTRIESDIHVVPAKLAEVFAFLSDLRNYADLMPEMVTNFTATASGADLKIQGLGTMHVKITDSVHLKSIKLSPSGNLPFRFTLNWELEGDSGMTEIKAVANAELNMFTKMMAEPQLKKFVEAQARELVRYFELKNPEG